jgi:Tfp pilus assembly protein PilV
VNPNRSGLSLQGEPRPPRARNGISLIEIVVACTLLAMALTALTGLSAKMAAKTRAVAYQEQKQATVFQEVNRAESMYYDSLSTYLVKDSVKAGADWYVWSYVVDPDSTSATGTSRYKKITLTVTPRIVGQTSQIVTIRRAKPPTFNALNTP